MFDRKYCKFWVVASDGKFVGDKHYSKESAVEEAGQMSIANQGQRFVVLESVADYITEEVTETKHEESKVAALIDDTVKWAKAAGLVAKAEDEVSQKEAE
jgi:hypothetical protein